MKTLIRDSNDAMLVPIPQYPLYSATLALYGGTLLPYYLQEEKGWALDVEALKQTVRRRPRRRQKRARARGDQPRQPHRRRRWTSRTKGRLVAFCEAENLLLVADEVYQENVYAEGKSFTSFKKVMRDMGGHRAGVAAVHEQGVLRRVRPPRRDTWR